MSVRGSGWAVLLVVLALALAACGGDDGGGDGGAEQASAPPADVGSTSAEPSAPAADEDADSSGGGEIYVVESGDTLSEIAKRFDTTVRAIVRANDLDDPDVIDVGQELTIP